jgi:hypothetical protein
MRYEVGGRAVTGWLRTLEPRRSYYWLKASRTLARALVGDPLESALLYLVIFLCIYAKNRQPHLLHLNVFSNASKKYTLAPFGWWCCHKSQYILEFKYTGVWVQPESPPGSCPSPSETPQTPTAACGVWTAHLQSSTTGQPSLCVVYYQNFSLPNQKCAFRQRAPLSHKQL